MTPGLLGRSAAAPGALSLVVWSLVSLEIRAQYRECQYPILGVFGEFCPRNPDPVRRWKALVRERFRGQEMALQMVERTFKVSTYLLEAPAMLHFSGPTGVGKSFLAKLLAEAVFARHEPICGFLELRMSVSWRHTPKEKVAETIEREILRPLVEQLAVCPASIIVIDDIHFLNGQHVRELRGIFDETNPEISCSTGTYKNKRWSTSKAFFIVTSDLDEKMASLSTTMSSQEATNVIRKLAQEKWGSKSLMAAPSHLVPFLPLDPDHLLKIAQDQLQGLEEKIAKMLNQLNSSPGIKIDWIGSLKHESSLASDIYEAVKEETKIYGARPINDFMQMEVYPLAIDVSMELLQNGSRGNTGKKSSLHWAREVCACCCQCRHVFVVTWSSRRGVLCSVL
uniref:AAA+ ATPase domain-containing protein n=1 Tax=Lotharella globosa TaxID=91324 RepID=A0A7S3YUK4_9EUKA